MKYIITADWHLRSQKPRCRLDEDWIETQRTALNSIVMYAAENKADVFCIGDIFHSTNETTNEVIGLVQEFALMLSDSDLSLYILAGNHDLPQHNIDNMNRSAFNILLNSKNIYYIGHLTPKAFNNYKVSAANFGESDSGDADIIFKHILCFPENMKIPIFNNKIVRPSELFQMYANAKYIFTGDYHRQFVYKNKNKMLFNPGCLLRQAADMIDYEPSVFLIDFDEPDFGYRICPIPDKEKMVTDVYLENEKERNFRIEAFIERIKDNKEASFDFIENVHAMMKKNDISKDVKNTIYELMENI